MRTEMVRTSVICLNFLPLSQQHSPDPSKVCQYGSKCYRKNPAHFSEYSHKHCKSNYFKFHCCFILEFVSVSQWTTY